MSVRRLESSEDDLGRWRLSLLALAALLVLALAGAALLPATVSAQRKSGRGDVSTEVVGGKPVAQGTFRFMAQLDVDDGNGVSRCGASLIAPRFVLTAAHCTDAADGALLGPEAFSLIIGRALLTDRRSGVKRSVVSVVRHPDWDPFTGANDAAVLELGAAVSERVARPLALVRADDTRFDGAGQAVVVAGWGRLSSGGKSTNRLRSANLDLIDAATCDAAYVDFGGIIPELMLCAGAAGRDSCQGDSGGPLIERELIGFDVKKHKTKKGKTRKVRVPIYHDVQLAIVSTGVGCADPAFPGVYTRLSNPGINDFIAGELAA
jgi:secreted trypsin-like serine protease